MEIFQANKMIIFILFFIPGFISIKVWRLLKPTDRTDAITDILEAISYSCINYAIMSPLLVYWLVGITSFDWWDGAALIFVLLIAPIIWPIIYSEILDSKVLQGRIKHPIPKAWDYLFSRGEPFFALVHLNNGDLIAGYFGSKSFASSYPAEEDIYFEETHILNNMGCFSGEVIDGTKGFLVNKKSIDYIEFYEGQKENDTSE